MVPVIPHSRPTVGAAESESVSRVIQSGRIAQGEMVAKFEDDFSRMLNLKQSVAVGSGSAGLHLALLAMDIGPGDEVIIPSFVCTALLNAVNYVGAIPVPADIDPETFNIDPGDVKKRITGRTRAVIVPHMFGLAADMDALLRLGVPIIEDCAQAVGGQHKNHPLGTMGRLAVFSFYATKVMATGEGGMVVSRDRDLISRIRDLRDYDNRPDYRVRYNYKMTDMQAAMGRSQLERLKGFILRRREIAAMYDNALNRLNLRLPVKTPGCIFFRYVVGVHGDIDRWIEHSARQGITCARPVHRPLHGYLGLTGYEHTHATWLSALSIPIYPSLTNEETGRVINALVNCTEEISI